MPTLSKSKVIAFRQCRKRLWLEVHNPELREDSPQTQARFEVGNQVGELARHIYDPEGTGTVIDVAAGFQGAFQRSSELLEQGNGPIFEAGFRAGETIAFADVMIPNPNRSWKMVEVKSSTSVKDYHREDVAVQTAIAAEMGIRISSVAVAVVDSSWTYPGGGDYRGLLAESDLTRETFDLVGEAERWIQEAHLTAALDAEPEMEMGDHCGSPFDCGFCQYCGSGKEAREFPVDWLPRLSPKQRRTLEEAGVADMRDVPESLLNPKQQRVLHHTVTGTVFFDRHAATEALRGHGYPSYFLDFETTNLAVPIWAGTRPYQQTPFQFSLHVVQQAGNVQHTEFLDLSGQDPSRPFAEAVIEACGTDGPVFVYSAKFENRILREAARRFRDLAPALEAVVARVVDLLPIAERCYYHPSQEGSWSIKRVLPAALPELCYDNLDGVKDGEMAMAAFAEAIQPHTSPERREEIRGQLLAYCKLDTLAMVRLWEFFRDSQG